MTPLNAGKIILLDSIDRYILDHGFSSSASDIITFIIACALLLLLIWIFRIIGTPLLNGIIQPLVNHSFKQLNQWLTKRKFYNFLIQFLMGISVFATSQLLFRGFDPGIQQLGDTIFSIYLIYTSVRLLNSCINILGDYYNTKPESKERSINSVLQSIKIVVVFVAVILVISTLLHKNPRDLLVALGAFTAIIAIVFKDTILGFIASIQINAQNLLKLGDAIEIPSRGVNGFVQEINIMNVKILNFDNTMSMIPTQTLVSEPFVNRRNMFESDGRRFLRSLLIDINSVKGLTEDEVNVIFKKLLVNESSEEKIRKQLNLIAGNTQITNIGLFRSYIEFFLEIHPKIPKHLRHFVRYLEYSEYGINMQIYAFSEDKVLEDYEHLVSEIMDHIVVVAPSFSIRFYQRFNGVDIIKGN